MGDGDCDDFNKKCVAADRVWFGLLNGEYMGEGNNSLDVFGLQPISDSVKVITQGTVDGASSFLGCICLPAAEEFGLFLRDKVSSWRANNAVKITDKAQKILEKKANGLVLSAHPRIIYTTIENGSWAEDDFMQNFWAGILASACTPDGKDESNIIFMNFLSQITTNQAKIIDHICKNAKTYKGRNGLIFCDAFEMEADELLEISGIKDIHQLDRELDHLRGLELIFEGLAHNNLKANVTPQSLCLQFYARTQGYIGSPIDFFGAVEKHPGN
jgi:hypothetical protein